jgi:hypothetical protein
MYSLELDGELIAGDYGCSLAGIGFLIKTTFSEAHERLSPGLVLRGMVLQAAIERRGSPPTVSSARLTDTSRAGLGASSSGADLGLALTSRDGYGALPTPGGL